MTIIFHLADKWFEDIGEQKGKNIQEVEVDWLIYMVVINLDLLKQNDVRDCTFHRIQ